MFESMNLLGLEIEAARRREVALEEMQAGRAWEQRVRMAAGAAIVAVGQWVAGKRVERVSRESAPTLGAARLQASGDRV